MVSPPLFFLFIFIGANTRIEQFSKYANLFFLFTAAIQQVPGVSPTNQYTTIAPLAAVLLASAFKEVQEDMVQSPHLHSINLLTHPIQKRHQSDGELNASKAKVLTTQSIFEERKWKNIQVGDVVRLENNDFIPADMILISSSEPEGLCYIETSNLDG
jgi:phospholipid-transporting ATPase